MFYFDETFIQPSSISDGWNNDQLSICRWRPLLSSIGIIWAMTTVGRIRGKLSELFCAVLSVRQLCTMIRTHIWAVLTAAWLLVLGLGLVFACSFRFCILLWPSYALGRPLYFRPLVSSFFLLFFFPRLFSAVTDWMSTILPHDVALVRI